MVHCASVCCGHLSPQLEARVGGEFDSRSLFVLDGFGASFPCLLLSALALGFDRSYLGHVVKPWLLFATCMGHPAGSGQTQVLTCRSPKVLTGPSLLRTLSC